MSIVDNSLKSFYVKGKYPQWIAWSVAVFLFAGAWMGVGAVARSSAMRDLRLHQDQWTEDGILVQPTDYSCVPAAIVMLLTEQGFKPSLLEIAEITGTDLRGTNPWGISKAGNFYGFDVIHKRMTFEEFMASGSPAIAVFRYKGIRHAAYISQIREYNILRVKDPVQGLLHFEEDGANEYFDGDLWDCYIFEREVVIEPEE